MQPHLPVRSVRPSPRQARRNISLRAGIIIGLIAKLMLLWRREESREMIAWLLCKHQAGHRCIDSSGPK